MSDVESAPETAEVVRNGAVGGKAIGSAARSAPWIFLFGLGYLLTARLSHGSLFQSSAIGLVWAPNALLLAALILTPRKSWWAVLAMAVVAHVAAMAASTPAWRLAWQIPANAAVTITAAEALRRFVGFPLRFEFRREVVVFTGVALATCILLACIAPAFVLSFVGVEAYFRPSIAFTRIALANISPLLFVTTAIVLCAQLDWAELNPFSRRRAIEGALIIGSVIVASLVGLNVELSRFPWLVLLTFPPLIWAAVRLGPTGASALLLCVAGVSIVGAERQLGPFVTTANADVVLSLQIFWITIWAPIMLLAAAVREREVVEATLHEQRNQLAHMQRLATVGELSGALAHELRQPMQSILANAQAGLRLLARDPCNIEGIREIIDDIVQQDQQAANVIVRLRSLLRTGESTLESLALESVIRDALALTRSTISGARVEVQATIPTGLPRVQGDRVQLVQLLVNLVVNGCESMADVPVRDRALKLCVKRTGQDRLRVSVDDCGVGLPVASEDCVFEPFFTTKDNGLGLGLSIGRSIADAHGGRLWAENNARRGGATFHLELPAVSGATNS